MYQTVGHDLINLYSQCMNVPLFRQCISGSSLKTTSDYEPTLKDEVEDLYQLLVRVKQEMPEIQGVATGAILSNYQRVRVENVCQRLGLVSLAYLWQMDQEVLLKSMIDFELQAVLIKVASIGVSFCV